MGPKRQENDIYKRFEERLKTFHSWPTECVKPDDLAKDGFIYSGNDDLVTCVYCDIELDSWDDGDSVSETHRNSSEFCPFVMAMDSCNENEGRFS